MVHGSGQINWVGVVGERPDNVQVAWCGIQEV